MFDSLYSDVWRISNYNIKFAKFHYLWKFFIIKKTM